MAIGDPYITRAELKAVLGITNTTEDTLIDRVINAASRAIERRSGWPTFWNTGTVQARTIDVIGKVLPVRHSMYAYTKVLISSGIASPSGFLVSGFSSPVLMPEDAIGLGYPADAIRLPWGASFGANWNLTVTAIWGWPSVPDDIKMATQMQAHRFYNRKGSPEGVAGSAEWGITRIPPLDPDVRAILQGGGFMKPGIG